MRLIRYNPYEVAGGVHNEEARLGRWVEEGDQVLAWARSGAGDNGWPEGGVFAGKEFFNTENSCHVIKKKTHHCSVWHINKKTNRS